MKFTPHLRIRLQHARRAIATRSGCQTARWSDDQTVSALSLIASGLALADAAAIVMGDAVLEDGRVDYDPGCTWIDSMLARRSPTPAECERIVDQWETACDGSPAVSNVIPFPLKTAETRRMAAGAG